LLLPRCINSGVSSAKRHAKAAGVELGFVKYMDQDFLPTSVSSATHFSIDAPYICHKPADMSAANNTM